MRPIAAAFSLATLLLATPGLAHDRPTKATAVPAPNLPSHHATTTGEDAFLENDKLFLWRVHWINHAEIQAGELAKANGKAEELVTFGKSLIADHRKAENAVGLLAKKKNLTLELTHDEYQRVRDDLSEQMTLQMDLAHERGAGFDREFLDHMASGHRDAVAFLNAYREKTQDPDIRAFIDETLPVIKEHQRTANVLLDRKNGDRQDVKGFDDVDVEKAAGSKAKGSNKKKERKHKDQRETDQQEEIETDIEQRVEPPADSGDTPDVDPM